MRKIGKIIVVLCIVLSGLALFKEDSKAHNYTEDFRDGDFTYGILEREGYDAVTVAVYYGNETEVIIQEKVQYDDKEYIVEEIGTYCFGHNQNIERVVLPETIKKIWGGAFASTTLKDINLSEGLLEIESVAFSGSALESIDLPDSLVRIGEGAFCDTKLTSINIPSKITKIEMDVFRNTKLTEVTIPENVKEIWDGAFWGCDIEKVVFTEGLTSIYDYAFRGNNIVELEFPESLSYIGSNAFSYNSVSKITFSENENLIIYTMAFSNNLLTSVTLPNIEVLDWGVFQGNDITNIFLEDDEMLNAFSTYNSLYGANKETKIINIHAPSFTNAEYQGTEQTYTIDKGENVNLSIEVDVLYQQISRYDDQTNTYNLPPEIDGAIYPYTGKRNFVPEVQWYKDGVVVDSASDKQYSEVMDTEGTFIYHAVVNGITLEDITVIVKSGSSINPEIPETPEQPETGSTIKTQTSDSTAIYTWGIMGITSIITIYLMKKKKVVL